jgi:hypothetical protein
MKNIRQPFLNELQATQNAFRLLARHRHQRLSQEEWQSVRERLGILLLFCAFLLLPFGSLLLPFMVRSSRPPVNYRAWARWILPTRGLR